MVLRRRSVKARTKRKAELAQLVKQDRRHREAHRGRQWNRKFGETIYTDPLEYSRP